MRFDTEFEHVARELVDQQTKAAVVKHTTPNFEFVPAVHDDPAYQAALHQELQNQLQGHKHAADILKPASPPMPMLPRAFTMPFKSKLLVYLNDDTTPSGKLILNDTDAYALKFRCFDLALDRQYHVSTKPWRDWAFAKVGAAYRRDNTPYPDDMNARACFSSLHHEDDTKGAHAAVVGNVLLWAVWQGQELSDLTLIVDQHAIRVLDLKEGRRWPGYIGSAHRR